VVAVGVVADAAAVAAAAVAAVGTERERHSVSTPDPTIDKTRLPNGVRVVTERMPEARSVSLGFWVGVGSRDEPGELAGASHFLEHLLFKGTPTRSARSISMAVDAVGGEINAYTARENTAYYTRLPASELRFGLDLLSDVLTSPAFRPNEIEAEREVILEELYMNEDTPDDVVHSALYEALYLDHPLGRETLGSRETIKGMSRDDIDGFFRQWYRPANLVIAAAGDLHHDDVVDAVSSCFDDRDAGAKPARHVPGLAMRSLTVIHRPTEQVNVAMGWRGIHYDDPARYALLVANHALGGGMSSRLFEEVREQRGLAYTVYTSPSSYADCGGVVLYAGTVPDRAAELFDVVDDVIAGMLADGLTEEEHRVALGYLEGSLVLGLEDSGSRMVRLATGETVRGEVISIDEHLQHLRAVTLDDAHTALKRVFDAPRAVSAVGPFADDDERFARFA
jgi:predicted Zn-dependent peptidase